MNAITTRVATTADLDSIAPLFDAYRQFYQQEPDLELARRFIGARLQNGAYESLGWIRDEIFYAYSKPICA